MGKLEHMACIENRKGAYRVVVGRPEVKRPLGRLIKMDLQNVRWGRHRLYRSGSI
jgi:hypothetical protein